MASIVGRCGFRCDLCPAYKENIHGRADRQRVSDGWFKYFGSWIPAERICCDGCRDERRDSRQMDRSCAIRPYAVGRGMENCGPCPDFGCETMMTWMVSRRWVEERLGVPTPEEDYRLFVLPYEARPRLDAIRRELG